MHENPEQSNFMKTVEEIKNAEAEYELRIKKAKEEASEILRNARETVQEEKEKTKEAIVQYKNSQLRKGSESIESSVEEMIKKAKKDGKKISGKKLDKKKVSVIVKEFLTGL